MEKEKLLISFSGGRTSAFMTNVEKATMLAEQVKPCTDDFYSGFYQGALIALNASSNDKNLNEETRKDFDKKVCKCYRSSPDLNCNGETICKKCGLKC